MENQSPNKHTKVGKDPRSVKNLIKLTDKCAQRKGKPWGACEDADVRRGWASGLSIGSIALIHGRTHGAIYSRLRALGQFDMDMHDIGDIWVDATVRHAGTKEMKQVYLNKPWKQAEAYMGYEPANTVVPGSPYTPLEFYYPQVLMDSAIKTYIREGRLATHSGMPTWYLHGMLRKYTESQLAGSEYCGLRVAQEAAANFDATFKGRAGGKSFVTSLQQAQAQAAAYDELLGLRFPELVYVRTDEVSASGGEVWGLQNLPKEQLDSAYTIKTAQIHGDKRIGIFMDGVWAHEEQTVMLDPMAVNAENMKALSENETFVEALKNAGFQLQALDVKSSQCVDKHADTNQLEQDMQDKIQNAINLLEEDVKYVKVRFLVNDNGQSYTYKHRGEINDGDLAVVVTPSGTPALVSVVGFDDVTDLQPGITYKWLVQRIDFKEYDGLCLREVEARKALRKSITTKQREEQLAELIGDLGESAEVRRAKRMLSGASTVDIANEEVEAGFEEMLAKIEKELANANVSDKLGKALAGLFGLVKGKGEVPGVPGMTEGDEARN